jgi:hypothetical protein
MQEVLKTIKDAMEGQLKVYADSIGDRLERTGTITNVKFTPQQKRGLLTKWRSVEDEAHKLMQEKFIKLMSDPKIAQFQQLKAQMDAYIEQIRWNKSSFDLGEQSDKSKLANADEKQIYNDIINTDYKTVKLEFDKPYKIDRFTAFNQDKLLPQRPKDNYMGFIIDNESGKVAYVFYENERGVRSRKEPKIYYFIEKNKGEDIQDAQEKLKDIMTVIQ